jgi:glycosyltransferase involved in cell wall biosynthesis
MKIVIAICTYRRPESLRLLMESLTQLTPPAPSSGTQWPEDVDIVVVDNDSAGEGAAMARACADNYPFTVHTDIAHTAGLSAARNQAVAVALQQNPDLVAFLDDDEWPDPQWLSELVRVQGQTQADAVGGPTRSVFPPEATAEQRSNAYYGADLELADGSACQLQAGGNFLIRADTLQALGATPFDPAYALSGGEDLAFFTLLDRRGARMYWASEARVNEHVPKDRLAPGWMRQRVVNIANSRVRVMQEIDTGWPARIVRVTKTIALGIVAVGLSVLGLVRPSLAQKAQLLRWKFLGKLTAHIGRQTIRQEVY